MPLPRSPGKGGEKEKSGGAGSVPGAVPADREPTLQEIMDEMNKKMNGQTQFMQGMEVRLGDRLGSLETGMVSVHKKVDRLEERMDSNEHQLPEVVARIVRDELSKLEDGGAGSTRGRRDPIEAERYWLARRSLRLWPIQGPDLRLSLRIYMAQRLALSPELVNRAGQGTIKTLTDATGRKDAGKVVTDEVLVVFPTQEIRCLLYTSPSPRDS